MQSSAPMSLRLRIWALALVKVNEAGTEAAAATAVSTGITSAPEPKSFDATRPFLFVIRDLGTGAALFVGRVVDPTAS
ncbi:MAG: hypothetical protein HS104_41875 [Polyangiaceae bacterium]|nr:hypothetical protein [Polyangiaceae bacterium]MCE7891898.1 hypothetical protein [Sorangiineae bacterium PRO1]MCL4751620.1 hypothetical protein [Myxococcales bacterium]